MKLPVLTNMPNPDGNLSESTFNAVVNTIMDIILLKLIGYYLKN